MSRLSWLHKLWWAHLGKPAQERALFRQLLCQEIGSVLEIGVGDGQRMKRIAKLAQLPAGTESLRYIGTDEFEAATSGRHLSLKQAHQIAGGLGFRASLIPGDIASAIPRVAHKMGTSDLIIVDGGLDPADPQTGLIGGWLNRLAHARSTVLACRETGGNLVVVDQSLLDLPVTRAA